MFYYWRKVCIFWQKISSEEDWVKRFPSFFSLVYFSCNLNVTFRFRSSLLKGNVGQCRECVCVPVGCVHFRYLPLSQEIWMCDMEARATCRKETP